MTRCPPGRPGRRDGRRRQGGGGAHDHRERRPGGRAGGIGRAGPPRALPDSGTARRRMTTPHPWRARLARVWPVAKYVIGLVLAALVFEQLTGHKGELTEATVAIEGLHWGWVVLGVAAEAGSFLAFAQVQRRLLRAGKADVGIGPMAAITLAAHSITNSPPAGAAI